MGKPHTTCPTLPPRQTVQPIDLYLRSNMSNTNMTSNNVKSMPALFGCFSAPFICAKACCASGIAVGEINESMGKSPCMPCVVFSCLSLCGPCGDIYHSCTTSKALRAKHGVPVKSGLMLCCTHVCCSCCAKAQELRLIRQAELADMEGPKRQTMSTPASNWN